MNNKEYTNILIVKLSSLGDVIHALPCAAALRTRFPNAKISWITEPAFASFLPGAPYLDEVLIFDKPHFSTLPLKEKIAFIRELGNKLKEKHYDLVLDLQGLFKSAVIAYLTGCKERLGYCEMREMSGLVSRAVCGAHAKEHVIERYLDVVRYLGAEIAEATFPLPELSKERQKIKELLQAHGILDTDKLIVMAPGTSWQTKCWPTKYYGELAARLSAEGYRVVVVGAPGEKQLGEEVVLHSKGQVIDFTGKTTLKQLAALFQRAKLFISGDTGPLHIAVAAGTNIVALYGPTSPDRTGPYGKHHQVLVANDDCRPCFKKKCDRTDCMKNISVDSVYQTAQYMLSKEG